MKRQRLSQAETRQLIDDYTLYRFGQILSPADLARQAGVEACIADEVFAQKPIPDADLNRIARTIDVSPKLLSEIAGYQDIESDTRSSLDRFFTAMKQQPKQRRAA